MRAPSVPCEPWTLRINCTCYAFAPDVRPSHGHASIQMHRARSAVYGPASPVGRLPPRRLLQLVDYTPRAQEPQVAWLGFCGGARIWRLRAIPTNVWHLRGGHGVVDCTWQPREPLGVLRPQAGELRCQARMQQATAGRLRGQSSGLMRMIGSALCNRPSRTRAHREPCLLRSCCSRAV